LPFPIRQLCARIDGTRRRHWHAEPISQLDDGADDRFELQRAAGLEILQHRRLVRADLFRPGHPLIDRDRHFDASFPATGQRNPAAIIASAIAFARADLLPSGSPKLMRLPSV
jgi:hypothetical protein